MAKAAKTVSADKEHSIAPGVAVFTPLTYAVVHFVSAHLSAHGKMPNKDQVSALIEFAGDVMAQVSLFEIGDEEPENGKG